MVKKNYLAFPKELQNYKGSVTMIKYERDIIAYVKTHNYALGKQLDEFLQEVFGVTPENALGRSTSEWLLPAL